MTLPIRLQRPDLADLSARNRSRESWVIHQQWFMTMIVIDSCAMLLHAHNTQGINFVFNAAVCVTSAIDMSSSASIDAVLASHATHSNSGLKFLFLS